MPSDLVIIPHHEIIILYFLSLLWKYQGFVCMFSDFVGTRVHYECPYALASFSESKEIPGSMELVSVFACRES